jgi:hypothetical protein
MCICTKMSVAVIEQCMDEDSYWTMKEWAKHTKICGSTVFWILWPNWVLLMDRMVKCDSPLWISW